MNDSYWKYAVAEGRQQQQQQQQQQQHRHQQPLHSLVGKRPRSDYDVPGGHDLSSYLAHEDARGTHLVVKDSDTIGASYDFYLRGTQFPPYSGGIESTRHMGVGLEGRHPHLMGMGPLGGVDSAVAEATKARDPGLLGVRPEISLPPDASNTLFIEGLPSDCSRREVAHIFRPFVGYKEVRLVTKGSRHSSGDPFVLCFVDFESPAEAATAKDALQAEEEWKIKRELLLEKRVRSVDVKEALRLQQQNNFVILDVRPEAEFKEAHPPGAINVQIYRLIKKWTAWDIARRVVFAFFGIFSGTEENPEFLQSVESKLDKTSKIIVACSSGGTMKPTQNLPEGQQSRSLIAAYLLVLNGYANVFHMEGGLYQWFKEDLPIESEE